MTTRLGPFVSTRVQLPVGLVDRDDGTVWFIVPTVTAGIERLALTTARPFTRLGLAPITPHIGLAATGARLFVRGGRLGYEPAAEGVSSHRVFSARHFDLQWELIAPSGWRFGDTLAFETAPDLG